MPLLKPLELEGADIFTFSRKTAFVTGASGGIGSETAIVTVFVTTGA